MEKQQAHRDVLISLSLGAIVTVIAAVSVINLLLPIPVFIPLFNLNAEQPQPTGGSPN